MSLARGQACVACARAHKNRTTPRRDRRGEISPVDGARMIKLSFTLLAEISDAPKTWLPNDIPKPD